MKKFFTTISLSLMLLSATLFAQTQSVTYQGIAINDAGQRLTNQTISLRLSILTESVSGAAVYVETQSTTSTPTGTFTVQVGQGNAVSGTFASINWMATPHFLKVEMDPLAGTNYAIFYNGPIAARATATGPVVLTTTAVTSITSNAATSGGNIISDGGSPVIARGICYGTTPNPTIANTMVANGTGIGSFSANLTGLAQGTTYHVRAYATNSLNVTYYGNDLSFVTTVLTVPSVTTAAIINITQTTATGGGNVTSDGGTLVTTRGVCWATTANPTITSNHTSDGSGSASFASSITGLTNGTLYHVRAYATNSVGTAYGSDISFTTAASTCGISITVNHIVGSVAPVTKSVTYSTVTNIPGATSKCWITSNLGADHQAASVGDNTEASAGWYWQFNRKQGYKHDGTTLTPAWTITSINESSDWLTANDPCTSELGAGWRLPTSTEWTNVDATGNWTTWTGPWASGLKLHAAGCLNYGDGSLSGRGSYGYYWSSSQDTSSYGWALDFDSGYSNVDGNYKALGFSVRCLRD